MLREFDRLLGGTIQARDEELGRIEDIYFEDREWTVRYLVADTRRWLPGRKVLLVPDIVERTEDGDGGIAVALTAQQVKDSPKIEDDAPVSAEQQRALHDFYGWRPYWVAYPGYAGPIALPPLTRRGTVQSFESGPGPHLRSAREVKGYAIAAIDNTIGHVESFLVDDAEWVLRYFVVDTRNWLPGRKVLLSPAWIEGVSWAERNVRVDLPRERIEEAPAYEPDGSLTRDDEVRLFAHYGRTAYWANTKDGD